MPPELTLSDGGPVAVSTIFPIEFAPHKLPDSSFTAWSWANGQALVQLIEGEPGIRQINLLFNGPNELHFTDKAASLFLQITEPDGCCNIISRPAAGELMAGIPGTIYTRLELYFPDTTMRLMATHFEKLNTLLAQANTGQSASLSPDGRPITPAMTASIQHLFRTDLGPELRPRHRKERGMELLFAALELFS